MARYTFTPEDRRKGGETTSQRYDMRARGRAGLQKIATKYFDGDIKRAGKALSTTGNVITDPTRNYAFQSWNRLPQSWIAAVLGHCEIDDPDGVAF